MKIIKKVIKIKYVIFLVQNIFKKWLAVSQSAFDQFYFTYSTDNTVKLNVKHCVRNFEKKDILSFVKPPKNYENKYF